MISESRISAIVSAATRVLSAALQDLLGAGVVSRAVYGEVPPRVEYALTARGESLIPLLRGICLWSQTEHRFDEDDLLLPCRQCRHLHFTDQPR